MLATMMPTHTGYRSPFFALIFAIALLAWPHGQLSHAATPNLPAVSDSAVAGSECVVLLHGLARTYRSMRKIERALSETGYQVANIDYQSRHQRVEALADSAITRGIEQCTQTGATTIHFVTHSLGGILVRYYLSQRELPPLGRVVMLAPPNQGSQVVDGWRNVPGFFWLNGPAGNQLGTDAGGIVRQLGPVTYPVGIVAGTRSINLILSLWLPNPDDGKVSVENTKVAGMADFITVATSHPFIAGNKHVIKQTLNFLRTGKFDHPAGDRARRNANTHIECTTAAELTSCEQ